MKDDRTHLAYKAEQAVHVDTNLVLSAHVHRADRGDAETLLESVIGAQANVMVSGGEEEIEDVVADKGYHSTKNLVDLKRFGIRSYIPEKQLRGRRIWKGKGMEERNAYRRRLRGKWGKARKRKRSEVSPISAKRRGGARPTWLRGVENINKRYLIQVAA